MSERRQINVSMNEAAVRQITDSGQCVTIVKNVVWAPRPEPELAVAWLAFKPLVMNEVWWEADYSLYASAGAVQPGVTIAMMSLIAVPVYRTYQFENDVFTIGSPADASPYTVRNAGRSALTFGLAQRATVNGAEVMAPLDAVPLEEGGQVTFTTSDAVAIFVSPCGGNGVVLGAVAAPVLTVWLSNDRNVADVGYDGATESFVLIDGPRADT